MGRWTLSSDDAGIGAAWRESDVGLNHSISLRDAVENREVRCSVADERVGLHTEVARDLAPVGIELRAVGLRERFRGVRKNDDVERRECGSVEVIHRVAL